MTNAKPSVQRKKQFFAGILPALAVLLLGLGSAHGQFRYATEPSGVRVPPEKLLQQLDKNRNGKITRDEYPGSTRNFVIYDFNADGAITPDEIRRGYQRGKTADAGDSWGRLNPDSLRWRMDRDRNGVVEREEFRGPATFFQRMDTDRDNQVTEREVYKYVAGLKKAGKQLPSDVQAYFLFFSWDRNKDGKVIKKEFRGSSRRFQILDANRDGHLTKEEFVPIVSRAFGGRRQGKGRARPNPEMMVRRMDRNGDGRISPDEFRGPPPMFFMMDTDGDGFLTVKELAAARARRAGR